MASVFRIAFDIILWFGMVAFDWYFYFMRKAVGMVLKGPAKSTYNKDAVEIASNKKWVHADLMLKGLEPKPIKLHSVCHKDSEKNKNKKPLLLMLHGFPEMWYSWRNQLEEFSDDFFAVAFDLRGFGASDKPQNEESYKMMHLVNDIKEVIEYLGYTECILMSQGWGSLIAYHFVNKYPQYVTKNIVMGKPHPKTMQVLSPCFNLKMILHNWHVFFLQLPFLPEFLLSRNNFDYLESKLGTIVNEKNRLSDLEVQLYKNSFSNPQSLKAQLAYFRNYLSILYSTTPFPKMKTPTLVFAAEKDKVMDVKAVIGNLHNLIQVVKVSVVPNSSHWINQDDVSFVNTEIRNFLEVKV